MRNGMTVDQMKGISVTEERKKKENSGPDKAR